MFNSSSTETFSFLVSTLAGICPSPNFTINSLDVPCQLGFSSVNSTDILTQSGSAAGSVMPLSTLFRFQIQLALSKETFNRLLEKSLPSMSIVARVSDLSFLAIINAPSTAPSNPLVPEIFSNGSSDFAFLVWWYQ